MFLSVNGGRLPEASTKYSVGLDVFANEECDVWSGFTEVIKLGIKLDLDFIKKHDLQINHYLALEVRSSMRMREISSLGTGIIDLDYPDEIKLILHNHSKSGMIKFKRGDKIGQLILMQHNPHHTWDYRTTNAERTGGWGSSGDR